MRVLRIGIKSAEDGKIEVSHMAVVREGTGIVEDPWNTVMNALRAKTAMTDGSWQDGFDYVLDFRLAPATGFPYGLNFELG